MTTQIGGSGALALGLATTFCDKLIVRASRSRRIPELDGIEGLNTRRTILRARGEECSAAYDRVPGRQGPLSKRRLKLSQRLTHTRFCSLQLAGRQHAHPEAR